MTVRRVQSNSHRELQGKADSSGYYGQRRDAYGPAAWAALEKYAGRLA